MTSFLVMLLPICLVACLVLAGCHEEEFGSIFRRGTKNFLLLLGGIVVGAIVIWGVEAIF